MDCISSAETPSVLSLRIVVLQTDTELWCGICGALSASAITYVVEESEHVPGAVHRLTFARPARTGKTATGFPIRRRTSGMRDAP
jgi:hypothetical protein